MSTLESRLNSDYDFLDDGETEEVLLGAGMSNKRSLEDAGMDENSPENGAADDEVEALKGASDSKDGEGGAEDLKKKKVKRRTFNDTTLTSQSGLVQVYEIFPDMFAHAGKRDRDIASDLKRLIGKYKEWGFQLFPNLAFEDLVNRCESLGSKGPVRGYCETLRDRERTHYLNTVLGVPLEEIISNTSAATILNSAMDSPVRVEKEVEKEQPEAAADDVAKKTNKAIEEEEEDIDYNDYVDHEVPAAGGGGGMMDLDLMMLQAMEQAESMTQSQDTDKIPNGTVGGAIPPVEGTEGSSDTAATALNKETTTTTATATANDSDDELLVVEGDDEVTTAPEAATAPDHIEQETTEVLTAPVALFSQTQVDDDSPVASTAPANPYGEFEVPEDWGEE